MVFYLYNNHSTCICEFEFLHIRGWEYLKMENTKTHEWTHLCRSISHGLHSHASLNENFEPRGAHAINTDCFWSVVQHLRELPEVCFGCFNSKLLSSGRVVGIIAVALVVSFLFVFVDSVDASFRSLSLAGRATFSSKHIKTKANKIKFRCQHIENRLIVRPGNLAGQNAAVRKF